MFFGILPGAYAQTTIDVRVAGNNDDAEENSSNGSMYLDSSDLELAQSPESEDTVGIRFTSISVPQGATITNAYIQFTCDETDSGSASLTIRGQNVDDAAGFTSTDYNISSRTKTSASVAWSPPAWNNSGDAGADQRTPDISAIVQEIVDRSGWTSGNDIAIIITGTGTRTAHAYNGSSSQAPQLHIEYGGAASNNTYYVRTDGNDSNAGTGSSAGQAWRTVTNAVTESLNAGDTVYVMAGTYSGEVKPTVDGAFGNPIQFIGDTGGSIFGSSGDVTIQATGGSNALDIDTHDYLAFTGFSFVGDGSTIVQVDSADGIELSKCSMTGGTRGVYIIGTSPEVDIVNCLIHAVTSDGIRMSGGTVTMHSTTIDGSGSDGVEHDSGTITITNSIISNSSSDGLDTNGGTMNHTYNNVWNNSGGDYEGTSASTGEISQDPLFTNGHELSSSSLAVDVGTSSGAPSDDIEGNSRPAGSGYDMGAYEYTPPPADLLGHWKLDEATGTTASDSSGNGNDGDLYGGVTFDADAVSPGARGDALKFNGTSDYIEIPNDATLQPNAALTIAAFVKGRTWGSGNEVNTVLRKGEGNPNNYQLAIADGQVALYLDDSDGNGVRGDTVLDANRWYHVAATWDGSFVRIYVDGELDMTPVAYNGPIGTDTRSLYIGGQSGADYFDGVLDDVRLYGKALAQSEVMDLYGQLIYYRFDEGAGSTAADSSYHNLDATLQGSSTWTEGQLDGAIEFDGASDAVTGGTFTPPADGTALFWMKVPGTPAVRGRLFGLHDAFEIRQEPSGLLEFDLNVGTGGAFATTVPLDTTDQWYHVAATFDSTNDEFAVYIDGILDTNGSLSLSQQAGGLLSIGTRTGSTEYFDGALDDLRIFNRILPPEEIAQIHSSGLPKGLRIIKWIEIK